MRVSFPEDATAPGDAVDLDAELESTAVHNTALDTVCYVSSVMVVVGGAGNLIALREQSIVTILFSLLSIGVVLCSLVLHRRRPMPWVNVAALAAAAIAALSHPLASRQADTSTILFVITYFGVILLPRPQALVWVIGGVVALGVVVANTELWVRIDSTVLNARWLLLGQLAVSAVWLWRVWDRELVDLRDRDRRMIESEHDRLEAIRLQERVRVARETLVHTHETVLNDLRYTIATAEPDRQRLAEQLTARRAAITPLPRRPSTVSVVSAVIESEGIANSLTLRGPDVELDQRHADALGSVLIEVIRNARRYAQATNFTLATSVESGRLGVRVRHDGQPGDHGAAAGIGRAIVIEESLAAIGGSAEVHPLGFDLALPARSTDLDLDLDLDGFTAPDIGRLSLSVITAGNAIGGLPFVLLLAAGQTSISMLAACLAAVVAIVLGAGATIQRRMRATTTAVAAVAASLMPLLAASATTSCDWFDVTVIAGTLTGHALCSAAVWCPSRKWWWTGLGWVVGMTVLYAALPNSCSGTTSASIRAAALPIACLALIFWSQNRAMARMRRAQGRRRRRATELAAADAALDVSRQLHDTVSEATALMSTVAEGAEIDDALRNRLRCLDAAIRAAIQTDPLTSGGLTQAARDIVLFAVDVGIPVRVLALRDSGDQRPVDPAIVDALGALVVSSVEGTAVLQVLSAPGQDVLLLTTTPAAAERSLLPRDWQVSNGPDDAVLEWSDDSAVVVAVVTRVQVLPDTELRP